MKIELPTVNNTIWHSRINWDNLKIQRERKITFPINKNIYTIYIDMGNVDNDHSFSSKI